MTFKEYYNTVIEADIESDCNYLEELEQEIFDYGEDRRNEAYNILSSQLVLIDCIREIEKETPDKEALCDKLLSVLHELGELTYLFGGAASADGFGDAPVAFESSTLEQLAYGMRHIEPVSGIDEDNDIEDE